MHCDDSVMPTATSSFVVEVPFVHVGAVLAAATVVAKVEVLSAVVPAASVWALLICAVFVNVEPTVAVLLTVTWSDSTPTRTRSKRSDVPR